MAAIKALAFYALGFFFFLQIPMLAASLGGGGPALANQFASAIAAAGGFVVGRGASGAQATSRALERGFARGLARMRTPGSVSRGPMRGGSVCGSTAWVCFWRWCPSLPLDMAPPTPIH